MIKCWIHAIAGRVLSIVLVSWFLPADCIAAQPNKVRISYSSRSNSNTPFVIALNKGFFGEEGMDVELIQVNPRLGATAVLNGDLDFTTTLESTFVRGDSNALFDLLVGIVRNAAETHTGQPTPVRVHLEQKGRELQLVVRGGRPLADLAKVRGVAENAFNGTVKVESPPGDSETLTITLPLPPQREGDRTRA